MEGRKEEMQQTLNCMDVKHDVGPYPHIEWCREISCMAERDRDRERQRERDRERQREREERERVI